MAYYRTLCTRLDKCSPSLDNIKAYSAHLMPLEVYSVTLVCNTTAASFSRLHSKCCSDSMRGRKYYVVRWDHRPGIYLMWEECKQQVHGVQGCEFKSFWTEVEAVYYLSSATP